MDLQIKLIKKLNRGFSLLEIVVVMSIFSLLFAVSTSVYNSFKTHENLEIATLGTVEAIRHAQSNAQIGKGDSNWGVKVFPNFLVIFKGSSYLNRDTSADQPLDFTSDIVASGLSEIVFTKILGSTNDTGTITLTNSYGTQDIIINEKGTITY